MAVESWEYTLFLLLHEGNENQIRFGINLDVTLFCEVTMNLVRGQFLCMCDLQLQFDL